MAKCPYCKSTLKVLGLRCRACRRYVLAWPYVVWISLVILISIAVLLELILRIL